ncbi:MAG: cobalt ECF transporter T component CbiQ [Solirubrobacteraceae bacterium]
MSGSHSLSLTGPVAATSSRIGRLDPRAKLVGLTSITVVAVVTPLGAWPVYVACAVLLAAVALEAGVSAVEIWRRAKVVLPLVLLAAVFIPFVRPGGDTFALGPLTVHEQGLAVFATVTIKASIGTVSAVLLGATTSFPAVLRALEELRTPRLLVLVTAFMYRYLFVIADEVRRMRAALAARAYRPWHALHAAAIGRVVAALFLRSHARGERVYLAMLSRGYDGAMPRLEPLRFGPADWAFVAAVLLVLLPVRVIA